MATQWTVLRVDDLRGVLNETDFDRVRKLDTQLDQPDPVNEAIEGAVNATRGKISAGGYRLSRTAGSVPPSLRDDTLWLVVETLWLRVVRRNLTDDQIRRIGQANKSLDKVASGDRGVEIPTDSEDAIATQRPLRGTTIVRQGKRPQYNANDFNGLI